MAFPPDLPAHERVADMLDQDDWNVSVHGRMAEFADDGDTVPIETHLSEQVQD